jgi:uncharacterized protein YecE (DUF72 family)
MRPLRIPTEKRSSSLSQSKLFIGPAGWAYKDWNGVVYPTPRPRGFHRATYLAEFFDTIEINTSFYHPLQAAHAAQWLNRVSANPRFLFTAKLWQKFTHQGDANLEDEKAVRAGFDILRGANKLGAVLLQFPFSFHFESETLVRLTQILDSFRDYPLVVEVRHSSWANMKFYELLHERGVGFCNIDQPIIGRSIKPSEQVTSLIGYVRLHGRRYDTWFSDDPAAPVEERYNYLYSEKELEPWAERVRNVSKNARTTFVITNNHFEGKGVVNALQLIHMLDGKKVKVPETLRHHYPQLDSIATEPSREPTLFPLPPK